MDHQGQELILKGRILSAIQAMDQPAKVEHIQMWLDGKYMRSEICGALSSLRLSGFVEDNYLTESVVLTRYNERDAVQALYARAVTFPVIPREVELNALNGGKIMDFIHGPDAIPGLGEMYLAAKISLGRYIAAPSALCGVPMGDEEKSFILRALGNHSLAEKMKKGEVAFIYS